MKIAVASSDGRIINQHFGHAERFLIFNVDGNQINFVEERKVEKYCSSDEDHLYDTNRLEKFYEVIKDCKFLLVCRIGTIPEKELEKRGIKTFILWDRIEEGIKKVAESQRVKVSKL
ncbi:MAG: dinitrogenase iron-molybdenum cofactor biosynthesis protein [Nitrospinae bacterium]|nr:dinitrogenase iron-molybdenum cofactor biosynthesis protein [Nitrospinota bacterium]